ncbi:MAG: sulfite exporter TauE/SafE family protein [Candidatus Cloacimonetes bacterium]|nr:sulfite exporter TauE/SafE family protein [Candidatus Cloacimonadota bacterium]
MFEEHFFIDGMTCINCQELIKETLLEISGIERVSVDYISGKAIVSFDENLLTFDEISKKIQNIGLGYTVSKKKSPFRKILQFFIIFFLILSISYIFKILSTSTLATNIPIAEAGMSYGLVFIIGLLTSLHCIAMCGGINLSQTLNVPTKTIKEVGIEVLQKKTSTIYTKLFPSFLYNSGRLISYTTIGVLVGSLGSVLTVSDSFRNGILIFAGIFMLIMGINMLGLFPIFRYLTPRLPKFKGKNKGTMGKNPFMIGILNGFLPCGPLQAMQLYALSTGSAIMGGISMFLFCLGTVPLMFVLGAMGSILSSIKGKSFSQKIMQTGAILVASMGVVMILNGWNFAGFQRNSSGSSFIPNIVDGVQIVETTLLPNRYPTFYVVKDIPVRWIYLATENNINGCNYRFQVNEFGINHTLTPGENIIEFLPTRTGRFSISCWMSMIHGRINVIELGGDIGDLGLNLEPAGVQIYLDKIEKADIIAMTLAPTRECLIFQEARLVLNDDGFEPAIIVVERDIPLRLILNIESLDPGNFRIIIPYYRTIFETEYGENIIEIIPEIDFDFSTGDHIFYGFVKVVEDLNDIDEEAIKDDVYEHETMIYPDEYFFN